MTYLKAHIMYFVMSRILAFKFFFCIEDFNNLSISSCLNIDGSVSEKCQT